ncbi:MAG: hypothetical protein IJY31_00670 [Muribaculaceae bacterium]|nr:hypothetical protein [Muribaculaceae bacterium]
MKTITLKIILLLSVLLAGITGIVAQEYEYVPLVREGVKWKCGMATYNYWVPSSNTIDPYSIHYSIILRMRRGTSSMMLRMTRRTPEVS